MYCIVYEGDITVRDIKKKTIEILTMIILFITLVYIT
jgi:hypothetical protein